MDETVNRKVKVCLMYQWSNSHHIAHSLFINTYYRGGRSEVHSSPFLSFQTDSVYFVLKRVAGKLHVIFFLSTRRGFTHPSIHPSTSIPHSFIQLYFGWSSHKMHDALTKREGGGGSEQDHTSTATTRLLLQRDVLGWESFIPLIPLLHLIPLSCFHNLILPSHLNLCTSASASTLILLSSLPLKLWSNRKRSRTFRC